jgi:hypothetical protein
MKPLAIVFGLAACGGKSEPEAPSCAQVMDHILEITKNQLVGHGDEVKTQRAAMVKQCEERKLAPALRKCLFESKTLDDIAKCQGKDSPAEKPRKPLPKPSP